MRRNDGGGVNGLRSAIGFLTIIPAGRPAGGAGGLAAARGWFPVVGLLLGGLLAGLDLALNAGYPVFAAEGRPFPPLLLAALVIVALIVLTRALHLDGFMDCCDALLGGFDRERRLAIMRDSHVGAFAVAGAAGLLLVKFAAIASLPPAGRVWILAVFPCLSRWAMLLALEFFPYARPSGVGTAFQPTRGRRIWRRGQLWAGCVVAAAAAVALAGPAGLALLAAAGAAAWGLGAWAAKLLGGVTGDVYGAINETAEVAMLVLAAMLAHFFSDALLNPMHWWAASGMIGSAGRL